MRTPSRSSARPSSSASRSGTPPTSTAPARSRRDRRSRDHGNTRQRDRRRAGHQGVLADARRPRRLRSVPQSHPRAVDASLRPARTPTTSTCTRSTGSIRRTPVEETMEALHDVVKSARPATSVPHRCGRGSSPPCSMWPRATAGPRSSPCRTSTASSTAKRSARCSRLLRRPGRRQHPVESARRRPGRPSLG